MNMMRASDLRSQRSSITGQHQQHQQQQVINSEAHIYDQFIKKLETTKQVKPYHSSMSMTMHSVMDSSRVRANSSDNSTFDSRNESAFNDYLVTEAADVEHDGLRDKNKNNNNNDDDNNMHHSYSNNNNNTNDLLNNPQQLFETRQSFVDRRSPNNSNIHHDSVDSFIERAQSQGSRGDNRNADRHHKTLKELESQEQQEQMHHSNHEIGGDAAAFFEEDGLPDAILKLDRRQAIPTPRHKNDVLVEIEASTVDRRDLMTRPGVRCTESLPLGVETTGMDCIGRVVQLTTHARAIYGISIDDRVAAIYPFEYKDCYKDKGRRNNRYALVDAGLVVGVPKHVDPAEASCMIRLYLSAFQSIQKGTSSIHYRYDETQLKGQSILIQNGQTELGRALIDLAGLLGAAQIFATGPTESHPLLMELGAVPLGAETFGWELFLEEKISMVLVQEMPTAENFEKYISILDENKGNMVYIHHGHKSDEDDLGIISDDVSCDGLQFHELARKAKEAMNSAKFNLRLACSPKYIVYEGVWPSCKANQSQFKEDLRYLLTLLGRGNLKPNVNECIGLEDVAGVQDRLELLGKKGTIVCLPTALYEKKAFIVSPVNSPLRDQQGFPVPEDFISPITPNEDPPHSYASDAGYVQATTPAFDDLSDFHRMRDTNKHENEMDEKVLLPALPEMSSYSNHQTSFGANHNSMSMGSAKQEYYSADTSSMVSSVGYGSAANISMGWTVLSDGALKTKSTFLEEDPPHSIRISSKESKRYQAFQRQKKAKDRRKRTQRLKKKEGDEEKSVELGSSESQDISVSSPTYRARKMRRDARRRENKKSPASSVEEDHLGSMSTCSESLSQMKEQINTAAQNLADDEIAAEVVNEIDDVHAEARATETQQISVPEINEVDEIPGEQSNVRTPVFERTNASTANEIQRRSATMNVYPMRKMQNESMAKEDQITEDFIGVIEEAPGTINSIENNDGGNSWIMPTKREPTQAANNGREEKATTRNVDMLRNALNSKAMVSNKYQASAATVSVLAECQGARQVNAIKVMHGAARVQKVKGLREFNSYRRSISENIDSQDSRDEEECARDGSSKDNSFSKLMNKWKHIDNKNQC